MVKTLWFAFAFFLTGLTVRAQRTEKAIVYFPFNKSYLTNTAAEALDNLLRATAGSPIASVKIFAYCDSIGSLAANDTLAIERANAIKAYLINKKVRTATFKTVTGYGKRVPLNDNSTDSLRALNRRAEVTVFVGPVSVKDSLRTILQRIQVGEKFTLININFYGGSHMLLPSSVPILDSLNVLMHLYNNISIEIQGYVCCVPIGQEGYDDDIHRWELSTNRAKTVYNFLLAKGISAGRLKYKGYGNRPLVEEHTEADRVTNRRVEIKITGK